ncbi:carbohydrate-binding module family 13 protein, partial [Thermoascus aurantiacus ATCC 26904]
SPRVWYHIKNRSHPYLAIDVINDPATIQKDAQIKLVPAGNFSGQFWQLRPSQTSPGSINLCTLFLGTQRCLDVYADDKRRPHLPPAGDYSGQQWQIEGSDTGFWRLTNSYSGPDLLLDVGDSNV